MSKDGKNVLVIDNYDSFTFNLVQYLGELGCSLRVHRNDQITCDEIRSINPNFIVISPGPGTPEQAGISKEAIEEFSGSIPILGICLGHQAIGEVYGGKVVRAPEIRHGKISAILHEGDDLFNGLPSPFVATRYHSLIVSNENLPSTLNITARTGEGLIMGLKVRGTRTLGVQFHPESFMTSGGKRILENFLCYGN